MNTSNGFESTKLGHLINQSKVSNELGNLIRQGTDNSNKSLPSKKMAIEFYERYKRSNIELKEAFNILTHFDDVFNNDFSMYPDQRQDLWEEETANQAIENILSSISKLNDLDANLLRDVAVAMEHTNINYSLKLMKLAQILRPNGALIQKKIIEYEQLKKDTQSVS